MFFTRAKATQVLREKGLPVGDRTLADKASRGEGPRYAIINGRAVYTDPDLDNWVAQEFSHDPRARRA